MGTDVLLYSAYDVRKYPFYQNLQSMKTGSGILAQSRFTKAVSVDGDTTYLESDFM